MSRRKQSNPRQIKRSVGEMEEGEENLTGDSNMSEREAIASSHDESADCDTSSSFYSEDQGLQDVPKTPEEQEVMWSTGKRKDSELWQMSDQGLQDVPKTPEEQEVMWSTGKRKDSELWQMPESLELHHLDNEMQVRACQSLAQGLSWGPYEGSINSSNKRTLESDNSCVTATLQLKDKWCWLRQLKVTVNEESANCTIDCKDNLIWCKTTKPITEGECLTTIVGQSNSDPVLNLSVKMEPVESAECSEQPAMYPASLHSDIQLLPQQAGMAAILATAVVNKDIFPCKSCGIWYRSERNLQAHLMYYCASRQKSASTPTEEKLKDPSPPERVCPFPQCNKSCPSASSLEIHVRSHSGERPFVCLICLSAFTTKANCERHLKVHMDSLNGVCHGCGFVSTTRDMLYSHLLTNHMACQSGSKGDSSSPRTGTPALPLTGVKVANPFLSLKCNQCEYVGDSESNLQQHVLLHVVQDTFLCNQCHEKLRSAAELAKHMEIHQDNASQHSMEETKDRDDERPPALNKDLSEGLDMVMKVKEEPLNLQYESEGDRSVEEGQTHPTPDRSSDVSSPRSTLIAKVKSECSSPTPASSLVHSGTASVMPEGTVLIPYMFSQETSTFPQASEILAKMSELVHSRLKQGANNYPLLYAGAPIQKGATCYECDITFNNINNYLAHKRLYCYSRHQQAENSTVDDTVKDSAPMNRNEPVIHSPTSGTENQNASSSQADSERDLRIPNIESKTPEIKNEDSATKDTSSEGESLSRVSEGSRSPSNSVEDFDDDPSKTVCEACNIRFTRHETYAVHKRLYCASRHDPPVRRPNGGKAAILQQTVRTRKRRKLFEIHGTSHQPLPPPSPSEISVHSPSTVILESAGLSNNVEALKIKQKALSLSSRSSDSLSLSTGYILTTQSSTTSPPGSSSDVDGPIDLSKKPRIKEEPLIHVTPLRPASHFSTDYHECTSCKISFNNVENYLTHKKYYCSATALQHIKVEHLARVKMQASASTKAKKNRMEIADPPIQTEELKNKDINTKCIPESPNVVHGSITPNNSPGMYHSTPDVSQDGPPLSPHVKTFSAPQRTHSVICPYCPLNGPIEGDLIDHFKNAHELLLAKQLSTGHTAEGLMHDISSPGKPMTNSISEISPQNSIVPAPSLKSVAQKEKTTPNAKDQRESVSSQSSVESPLQNISPKPLATSSPNVALKILPVPESPRNVGFKSLSPSMNVDKSVQTAMSLPSPVQNGNHRYCRLCNIKFSSLSTFIAHKKYYCSSHTAEHVK
ncbi:zinc finger protein ZFPM1 isoform X3 [Scyliorhinus canicula]|uniref:zinc finger protein ZFPM1 isoform X3 n=1 Tax=Scyliorhinus canicula TaxID=7830 RepID=UPI0018F4B589|nr:zinc finger protein ZFPM1 isoform X3 [Scyliorhinus canicula]